MWRAEERNRSEDREERVKHRMRRTIAAGMILGIVSAVVLVIIRYTLYPLPNGASFVSGFVVGWIYGQPLVDFFERREWF